MKTRYLLILIAILAALWAIPAAAQSYDCTQVQTAGGAFVLTCSPKATPAPTDTPTETPTCTPTVEPTATATATPFPPTNTPEPEPTASPTPTNSPTAAPTFTPIPSPTSTPSPSPVAGRLINVPLLPVAAGAPELDSNNWSILWAGTVAAAGDYFQVRLVGSDSGLHVYAQMVRMHPSQADAFTLTVNGYQYTARFRNAPGWSVSDRCGAGDCRGWSAERLIPWGDLGGNPASGDTWALSASHLGATWAGTLRWDGPDYRGTLPGNATVISMPLVQDATQGGSTDCGDWAWPDYHPTWGDTNTEATKYRDWWSVQNQWDTADWPCYVRYAATWALPTLPPGATLTGAWLDAYKFGHSGYPGESTGVNIIQAWELSSDWQEDSITWNNAPAPGENISRTPVGECAADNCQPGEWHTFDVSEIVRRAYARGDAQASVLMYTAAGQYHSGRYFYSRQGAAPPNVRIAYVTDVPGVATPSPTVPPTPTPTSMATATATPQPTATSAPATATHTPTATPIPTVAPTATAAATPTPGAGRTYYMTPADSFDAKIGALRPGDTLILRDGVYRQSLIPSVNGTATQPITIRAENDGKAIIDGEGKRTPVEFGHTRVGRGNHFIIEGIVARNGKGDVWYIRSDNVTLRRVSGYNASTDDNSSVFTFWTQGGGLLEDCIAAGTGRKMILLYQTKNVTVRRCYTAWQAWDGRNFCGVTWPNAETVEIYNGDDNRIENSLVTGPSPVWLLAIQANSDGIQANRNQVLGSIVAGAGMASNGSAYNYGPRPLPSACGQNLRDFTWPSQRAGIALWGQGTLANNVFRDVLSVGNAGLGFTNDKPYGVGATGTIAERLTIYGNGAYAPPVDGGKGTQAKWGNIRPVDSCIGSATCAGGARLTNRYVDGVLTSDPILPWPMESRGIAELGVSISAMWRQLSGQ